MFVEKKHLGFQHVFFHAGKTPFNFSGVWSDEHPKHDVINTTVLWNKPSRKSYQFSSWQWSLWPEVLQNNYSSNLGSSHR